MEIRVEKPLQLEQLTDEIRKAIGAARIHGVSARSLGDDASLLTVHATDAALTALEQTAVRQVVDAHVPDESWGLSADQKTLTALLDRPAGSLSTADIEAALRLIVNTLGLTTDHFPLLTRSEEQ
jgi:hypothetical protein